MNGKIENQDAVREALRNACYKDGGNQKKFAASIGVSPVVLSDMIRGRRDVSNRIAEIVGFTRVAVFRKIKKDKS